MSRIVCWWSDGIASAIATMLVLKDHPEALIMTCDTGAEDDDNLRFRRDCERRMNRTVQVLKSERYASTWDVWEQRRFMSSPYGAPCSGALKKQLREDFEQPGDTQVFGYTADPVDVARFKRMSVGVVGELWAPLIDRGITKSAALGLMINLGIDPPRTYALGVPNANCVKSGCVKSTSPAYWALIRQLSPEGFARTAALARTLNVRMAIVSREKMDDGRTKNIRGFIDDIPADQPTTNPICPQCDFLCQLTTEDLAE